jgi:hypothetical protein
VHTSSRAQIHTSLLLTSSHLRKAERIKSGIVLELCIALMYSLTVNTRRTLSMRTHTDPPMTILTGTERTRGARTFPRRQQSSQHLRRRRCHASLFCDDAPDCSAANHFNGGIATSLPDALSLKRRTRPSILFFCVLRSPPVRYQTLKLAGSHPLHGLWHSSEAKHENNALSENEMSRGPLSDKRTSQL